MPEPWKNSEKLSAQSLPWKDSLGLKPNKKYQYPMDCGGGCLFDLDEDEGELKDLASHIYYKRVLERLQAKFKAAFDPEDPSGPFQAHHLHGTMKLAAKNAAAENTQVWGPYERSLPENAFPGVKVVGNKIEEFDRLTDARQCRDQCLTYGKKCDGVLGSQQCKCKAWAFLGVTEHRVVPEVDDGEDSEVPAAPNDDEDGPAEIHSVCTLFWKPKDPKYTFKHDVENLGWISGVMDAGDLPAPRTAGALPTPPSPIKGPSVQQDDKDKRITELKKLNKKLKRQLAKATRRRRKKSRSSTRRRRRTPLAPTGSPAKGPTKGPPKGPTKGRRRRRQELLST